MGKWKTTLSPTEELVVYIANNYNGKPLTQLVVHKLMYLIDKKAIQKLDHKITSGVYIANKYGPTHNFLNTAHPNVKGWVNIVKKGTKTYYFGLDNLDKYSFSSKEKSLIDSVLEQYRDSSVDDLIKTTHDSHWSALNRKKASYVYDKLDDTVVPPETLTKIRKSHS